MIQLLCLALLVLLVVFRGPRAVASASARPAWWATVSGVVALSTYGWPIPLAAYDRFFGNSNVTTLVRDLGATSAFWFFREALAWRAGSRGRFGSRWGLAIMLLSFTIPFFLITNRGPTAATFITDRLDQTAVWLYGVAYMAGLLWMACSGVLIARKNWKSFQSVFITGFLLVIASCVIEVTYLTATHFGYGGQEFRYAAWNVSELPFFLGIGIIILGIAWVTLGTQIRRRIIVSSLQRIARRHALLGFRKSPTLPTVLAERALLAQASKAIVLIDDAQVRGDLIPTRHEMAVVCRARKLFAPDRAFRPMLLGNQ